MFSVFIVEDEAEVRNLYNKFLVEMGFNVKAFAKNGKEAVEMFKIFTQKPDIIIMDYNMPEKNGIEAAREILKIDSKIKIIMISGDSTIKKEALSIGIWDFKSKSSSLSLCEFLNDIKKDMTCKHKDIADFEAN